MVLTIEDYDSEDDQWNKTLKQNDPWRLKVDVERKLEEWLEDTLDKAELKVEDWIEMLSIEDM